MGIYVNTFAFTGFDGDGDVKWYLPFLVQTLGKIFQGKLANHGNNNCNTKTKQLQIVSENTLIIEKQLNLRMNFEEMHKHSLKISKSYS